MRRAVAFLCMCWLAYCGAPRSNTLPLAFGMTPREASTALGLPLIRHSGRHGSKIYLAAETEPVPGFFRVGKGAALQFRRGRLTGWKQDWRLSPAWPF